MLPSDKQSQKKYVLAIDLGSGGPKVALVDQDGLVVTSHSVETQIFILPEGGAEQDPHEWWSAVVEAAKKVIQAAALDARDIVAVSCTGQYSVIVPVDEQGDPLMNAVHWTDTRGAPYNKAPSKQPRAASSRLPRVSGRLGSPQQKLSRMAMRAGSAPQATALRTASSITDRAMR